MNLVSVVSGILVFFYFNFFIIIIFVSFVCSFLLLFKI